MPQELSELGAEYIKQQRSKEQEKNQNAMTKMRMQALEREAQSYEDREEGASETMRKAAPLVAMWQDQAAQAQNETRQANRRAVFAEMSALQGLAMRDPGAQASMDDVLSQHKLVTRAQVFSDYAEGKEVDPFLAAYAMGPETAAQLPGAKAAKEYQGVLEGQFKFSRQQEKEMGASWQSEMNAVRRAGIANGFPEEDIAEQQKVVSARYVTQMQDLGMTPTATMHRVAGTVPLAPSIGGPPPRKGPPERLRAREGKPVYEGREDITYGKQPRGRLDARQEEEALRDSYRRSIKDALGPMPSGEMESLIDELLAEELKSKEKKPYGGKVSFKYQAVKQPKYRPQTERDITAWKEREKKRKEKEKRLARPQRMARGVRR